VVEGMNAVIATANDLQQTMGRAARCSPASQMGSIMSTPTQTRTTEEIKLHLRAAAIGTRSISFQRWIYATKEEEAKVRVVRADKEGHCLKGRFICFQVPRSLALIKALRGHISVRGVIRPQ
jgi:hypothetical protein